MADISERSIPPTSKDRSLVQRLREAHPHSPQYLNGSMILAEAADEIERLTRELRGKTIISDNERDRETERLRTALTEARAILARSERGATHWEGCESQHPACAAMKVIDGALSAEHPADETTAPLVKNGYCTDCGGINEHYDHCITKMDVSGSAVKASEL